MKRLALFAHFDAQDEVKRYVVHYLRELRPHCRQIDFISTSKLPELELAKVRPLCGRVETKENIGFDFGMWQHGFRQTDLEAWDEILLTNSSVFGPVYPLGPLFSRAGLCDFWGLTDNLDLAWHIQSYFLAFRRPVLRSALFRKFWDSVLPFRDKFQVIRSYELGLSVLLTEAGFRGVALYGHDKLFPPWPLSRLYRHREANATCHNPARLLQVGMPFVKVELLRNNPMEADLAPVLRRLRKTGYDLSLVEFDRPRTAEWSL